MSARPSLPRGPSFVRFRKSTSGNVAMLFGLLLLPMLGAIGLAVDYGTVLTARNLAQVGADAAALQASGVARDLIQKGNGSDGETTAAIAEAKRRATALFDAYAAQNGLSDYSLALQLVRDGQHITATAGFSVDTETYLAKLYGQASYTAGGRAVAGSSLPSYVDVYLAMDASQSMGIAATNDEMVKLAKVTTPSCVFGCHGKLSGQTKTNQAVAKSNGIRLRIDVLRDAVDKMIATATKDGGDTAIYRFAMYTMSGNPTSLTMPYLKEISPISDDLAALAKKTPLIDLGENDHRGIGDSHINEQIATINAKIPTKGDGSSQAKARNYLFVVTDGLRDVSGPCTSGHCTDPISPAACKAAKDKDIIVGVLYTTYLPIYQYPLNPTNKTLHADYRALVSNPGHDRTIAPKLTECASPGWFFEASDAAAIDSALAKMFEKTATTPALTR